MSCPFITEVAPVSCGIVYALMATVGLVWLILLSIAVRVIAISLGDETFFRKEVHHRSQQWEDEEWPWEDVDAE